MNTLLKKTLLCLVFSFVGQIVMQGTGFASCSALAYDPHNKIAVGFNLTHTSIDLSKVSECKKSGAGETLEENTNIVRNYDNPLIRAKAIAELKKMSQEGATVLRTFIWLEPDSKSGHRIGALNIKSSTEIADVAKNLSSFIREANEAGYSHIFVALAPQSTLSPNCRRKTWGDCYNEKEIKEVWEADKTIIAYVKSENRSEASLTFDLGNELCFDGSNTSVNAQTLSFVKKITRSYVNFFHDRNFTVSCTASTADLLIRRLSATYKLFKQDQTLPSVITLHLSQWPKDEVISVAEAAIKIAHDINATIAIDEIPYDSPKVYASIANLISRQNDTRIESVLFWPNSPRTGCSFSVAAPYNLQPMETALGVSVCH
jgi:hypothetical protein